MVSEDNNSAILYKMLEYFHFYKTHFRHVTKSCEKIIASDRKGIFIL